MIKHWVLKAGYEEVKITYCSPSLSCSVNLAVLVLHFSILACDDGEPCLLFQRHMEALLTGLLQHKNDVKPGSSTTAVHFSQDQQDSVSREACVWWQARVLEASCAARPNWSLFFNPSVSLPRLVDMDWRVDIKTSSDTINRMAVPTCLLQLKVMSGPVQDQNNWVQHLIYQWQHKIVWTGIWCLLTAWRVGAVRPLSNSQTFSEVTLTYSRTWEWSLQWKPCFCGEGEISLHDDERKQRTSA